MRMKESDDFNDDNRLKILCFIGLMMLGREWHWIGKRMGITGKGEGVCDDLTYI